MSLSASLFAGVSGLRNHQVRMDVIGDNIANVNTIGFKASRANFQEALVQTTKGAGRPTAVSGGTNPVQLGLGMQIASIDKLFQQGGLESTGQISDLAIQGSGFFILSDATGLFFSRAGAFGFDANSNLVDPSTGLFVQGKMADASGNIPATAQLGNIRLPFGQQDPAKATEIIQLANNLDSSATDSFASLITAGPTNISLVTGKALDGVGGVHTVTIALQPGETVLQPTNSTFTGTNAAAISLTPSTRLKDDLGINDFSPFSLTLDGGPGSTLVSGLSDTSTVSDLIDAINQIPGVTAALDTSGPTTELKITRTYAGDGGSYNILSSNANATGDDVLGRVFGIAPNNALLAANGTPHHMVIVDSLQQDAPSVSNPPGPKALTPVFDQETGLIIGIEGLGGGGVTITGNAPLQAGTATIRTEPTTHATSITVFDSQGGEHALTIQFTKQAQTNTWSWEVQTIAGETPISGTQGEVIFNPDGSLQSFSGGSPMVIEPGNGAENMTMRIDVGTISGYDGLTGFASPHTAAIINQDGFTVGILDKISIDKGGNINGIFTNGISRRLAQVYLADFNNVGGLVKAGRSMFQISANSGQPVIGVAGETISGAISSGALESSSVDIAAEFTNMIIAQRGFQANSRIITTSDSMLDELVNLKR
ncbi:MAG TPA: flagellar hook-basal body complex protein [candidate division Zixibacteria bacterium]|nr:flagellar hook-basal body complex protein [candidate division Zixibacteria bacterium]